jgi:DNA polymerase I-like protein with 3'-5' exonuclease and polymerase domains
MGKNIHSWEDLQKNVTKIAATLNKDQNLLLAAASNPIFALEELGYKIDPGIIAQVEDKMRFTTKQVVQLSKLRKSIYTKAGKDFHIRSQSELNKVLFEDLSIEAYDAKGCLLPKEAIMRQKREGQSTLSLYKNLHPIIEPLLAFEEINASVSGFCDAYTSQKIRSGKYGEGSNIKLTIKLKKTKK